MNFGGYTLLTYDEAVGQGIPCNKPEIEYCEFCGEPFTYRGFVEDGKIKKFYPISCKCETAKRFREEEESEFLTTCIKVGMKRQQEELMREHQDGISERYKRRTFKSFDKNNSACRKAYNAIKSYADNFPNIRGSEKNSLFLYGGCGCGKTHLACAVANQLRGTVKCRFTTFEDLLLRIKKTYDKNAEEKDADVRQEYKDAELLIIDDMAKEKSTDFSTSILFDIVNYRYEKLLPIIVTANHDRQTLIERLTPVGGDKTKAEAIVSRLFEMSFPVSFEGVRDARIFRPEGYEVKEDFYEV